MLCLRYYCTASHWRHHGSGILSSLCPVMMCVSKKTKMFMRLLDLNQVFQFCLIEKRSCFEQVNWCRCGVACTFPFWCIEGRRKWIWLRLKVFGRVDKGFAKWHQKHKSYDTALLATSTHKMSGNDFILWMGLYRHLKSFLVFFQKLATKKTLGAK